MNLLNCVCQGKKSGIQFNLLLLVINIPNWSIEYVSNFVPFFLFFLLRALSIFKKSSLFDKSTIAYLCIFLRISGRDFHPTEAEVSLLLPISGGIIKRWKMHTKRHSINFTRNAGRVFELIDLVPRLSQSRKIFSKNSPLLF